MSTHLPTTLARRTPPADHDLVGIRIEFARSRALRKTGANVCAHRSTELCGALGTSESLRRRGRKSTQSCRSICSHQRLRGVRQSMCQYKTRPLSPINVSIQDATPISPYQCVNTRRDPYLPLSPASDSAKSNARQWPVAACRFRCNWRRLTPPLEPDRVLIATAADSACPAASGVASSMHGQPRLTATVSSRTEFT
jgi:hypothetical protein